MEETSVQWWTPLVSNWRTVCVEYLFFDRNFIIEFESTHDDKSDILSRSLSGSHSVHSKLHFYKRMAFIFHRHFFLLLLLSSIFDDVRMDRASVWVWVCDWILGTRCTGIFFLLCRFRYNADIVVIKIHINSLLKNTMEFLIVFFFISPIVGLYFILEYRRTHTLHTHRRRHCAFVL